MMLTARVALLALALCAGRAFGQAPTPDDAVETTTTTPAARPEATPDTPPEASSTGLGAQEAATEPESEKKWAFSALSYLYFVPGDRNYVQPTFTADRDWLHLEARYNYEAFGTASLWTGYNFSGGESLTWEITPMLGGVFGHTNGIAPGYKGALGWWKLELYSEGEFVFDTGDFSDSFFYTWSELTISPVDWFRFGLVIQRTRAYESDRDIQRGLIAEVSFEMFSVNTSVFNLDEDPMVVVGFGLSF